MDLNKYHKKGLIGLENLGNTCFLNSCMQIISNMYELNDYLDSKKYFQHIKTNIPEYIIINEWNELREIMWSNNGIVSPKKFVHNVQKIAKEKNTNIFTGWAQNDLPEFLQFFIECLHNSISRSVSITINGVAENKMDKLAFQCYEMLKNSYSQEYSEIMEMFYGITFSELVSLTTNERLSVVPESFFILNLPIANNKVAATNLYECFDLYIEPDYLEGENAWYNDITKTKEDVKKRYSFWSFPSIVVIALKRFSPDGQNKMNNSITFPLNDLDLSKYVEGYNSSSYVYDLFGVCNHNGDVSGGHYTCFVKNTQDKWNHFNDHIIEKVEDPQMIISSSAYCLFYRKKNNLL